MSPMRVFVDATALYSATHRNWILGLREAVEGRMFTLSTSEDVLVEAQNSLRNSHPEWDGGQISTVRKQVHAVFDEVLDDFPGNVPYPGSDPDDQHVHAAAISCQADMLLTQDKELLALSDDTSGLVPYEPIHPDSFFVLVEESNGRSVEDVIRKQLLHFESKGRRADLPGRLRKSGCPRFAAIVTARTAGMAGPRAARRHAATKS